MEEDAASWLLGWLVLSQLPYAMQDSLPREWCRPRWAGLPTSLNVLKMCTQTGPQANPT